MKGHFLMTTLKRWSLLPILAAAVAVIPLGSTAAPLPSNCTKTQGTVSCFSGPGKNQAGVGSTAETQGNTTNLSPTPQDLGCTSKPPKSQGAPNSC
jgi:hypothetical protein